jgi:mannose/cellobiose epimerase-like protein (N-acyl-D-glucosamine 2-epimerase family)
VSAIPPAIPGDREWRAAERARLVGFAERSLLPSGGFAWLDDGGVPDASQPLRLWINARMTHIFGLEAIHAGSEGAREIAAAGVGALGRLFEDRRSGGWFEAVAPDGAPVDASKAAYGHAFVVLAAATGTAAGVPGARDLLGRALEVVRRRFVEPGLGTVRERYRGADWTGEEAYRGANANMHTVEGLLTAAAALSDQSLARDALRIAERVIGGPARQAGWRVVEHFDGDWRPLPEFNADNPGDHFRPYGLTIGHWLEWSRLLLAIEAALDEPPAWLAEGAAAMFDNGYRLGWPEPSSIGCPYTVDWDNRPVVQARLFWVTAEGILAADALARRTGDETARAAASRLWAEADRHFLDRQRGGWHSELAPDGTPASTVWSGKPDSYHAYQACLFPDLPVGLGRSPGGDPRR